MDFAEFAQKVTFITRLLKAVPVPAKHGPRFYHQRLTGSPICADLKLLSSLGAMANARTPDELKRLVSTLSPTDFWRLERMVSGASHLGLAGDVRYLVDALDRRPVAQELA